MRRLDKNAPIIMLNSYYSPASSPDALQIVLGYSSQPFNDAHQVRAPVGSRQSMHLVDHYEPQIDEEFLLIDTLRDCPPSALMRQF